MKKLLAMLLASVMTVGMLPMTALAKTDNRVDKEIKVEKGAVLTEVNAPTLKIENDDYFDTTSGATFYITLEGAEWDEDATLGTVIGGTGELLGNKEALITINEAGAAGTIEVKLSGVKVTGGEAYVKVDSNSTGVSDSKHLFAKTDSKKVTVVKPEVVIIPVKANSVTVEDIIIKEELIGSIDDTKEIKIRLYGDFEFVGRPDVIGSLSLAGTSLAEITDKEIIIDPVSDESCKGRIKIENLVIAPTRDCEIGDTAEIVISGAGIEKTTIKLGTVIDYGMTFEVENEKLPVFYSGRTPEEATLEVTVKESTPDSWRLSRKTTFTFPEGVEVTDFSIVKKNSATNMTKDNFVCKENVVTLTDVTVDEGKCAEFTLSFNVAIDPQFTGDVTCELGGSAIEKEMKVTVAEVKAPIVIEAKSTDVSIDYRNVSVNDIVIKEAFVGALEKDKVLALEIDGHIELEKGMKFIIDEGDIEIEVSEDDGKFYIEVIKESHKDPAVIRITNIEAYLNRSLPAGEYGLKLILSNTGKDGAYVAKDEAYFQNYDATKDKTGFFTTDEIEIVPNYINIVTAGRDKDDSTFTTTVKITIGAYTMTAGEKVIALDVPAYISNGYTMLPVRAVADALSGDAATILWDDATKTVTIGFGARIISMTIGSKVMTINGVIIPMNAAPEITNGRTFIPVRDLAYALGLTDKEVNWDDPTKTVTLN